MERKYGVGVVIISLLSVGLYACGPSDAALDRAVQRYMVQQDQQKKVIVQVVQDELAKKGGGAPSQPQAPAAEPSIDAQLANPTKIDIGQAPIRGKKDAKVTIVEFSDFQCPFCGRATPTMEELLKAYDGKVRVIFKNNPLPFHPNAKPAAIAAVAAQRQGKFWEMHDKLFANQATLSPENYEKWAKEIGLDVEKFKKDMQDPAVAFQIDQDVKQAASVGASGTPTFFVNGVKLVGAKPTASFKEVIDKVLK